MKRIFTVFFVASFLPLMVLWYGCEADVNLNDVDKTVLVKGNVAIPVGSTKIEIGDFIGDGSMGIYVDSLNNRGVLTFRDTFSMTKNFHKVELTSYISKASVKMDVYEKLQPVLVGGNLIGTGVAVPVEFPLTLKLTGINNNEDYQRLDSALIKDASFVSNIVLDGGLSLEWDWIEKVTITLGEAFHRKGGNVLDIYTKGQAGYGFGEDIPINVDEFSMNLMKNKTPITPEAYGINNVVDYCDFVVTFWVNIPVGTMVAVPSSAALNYNLNVQFIDYHAIWGMFKASSDMSDEREVSLTEELGIWQLFQSATLPFADPKMDMKITTQIAGALMMKGDYIYVKEEGKEPIYATFDGNKNLYKYFNPNEYLSLNSTIGDSATMHVLFDKDPARGCIDKLFTVKPDYFGYKFSVDFFRQETPQIRVTDNTDIRVDAECELPLIFNQGVSLAVSDTIENIDFSALSLDSILSNSPELLDTVREAALTLALQVENSIPLQFKGSFVCLDENDDVVIDPKTSMPVQLIEGDTLYIGAPEHKLNLSTSAWDITPAKTKVIVKADADKLNTLNKVKKIVFCATLDDESLDYAYKQGYFNVKITEHASIGLKIGLGANLEAVLDLNSLFE
jgi:hypothetical protein